VKKKISRSISFAQERRNSGGAKEGWDRGRVGGEKTGLGDVEEGKRILVVFPGWRGWWAFH